MLFASFFIYFFRWINSNLFNAEWLYDERECVYELIRCPFRSTYHDALCLFCAPFSIFIQLTEKFTYRSLLRCSGLNKQFAYRHASADRFAGRNKRFGGVVVANVKASDWIMLCARSIHVKPILNRIGIWWPPRYSLRLLALTTRDACHDVRVITLLFVATPHISAEHLANKYVPIPHKTKANFLFLLINGTLKLSSRFDTKRKKEQQNKKLAISWCNVHKQRGDNEAAAPNNTQLVQFGKRSQTTGEIHLEMWNYRIASTSLMIFRIKHACLARLRSLLTKFACLFSILFSLHRYETMFGATQRSFV